MDGGVLVVACTVRMGGAHAAARQSPNYAQQQQQQQQQQRGVPSKLRRPPPTTGTGASANWKMLAKSLWRRTSPKLSDVKKRKRLLPRHAQLSLLWRLSSASSPHCCVVDFRLVVEIDEAVVVVFVCGGLTMPRSLTLTSVHKGTRALALAQTAHLQFCHRFVLAHQSPSCSWSMVLQHIPCCIIQVCPQLREAR